MIVGELFDCLIVVGHLAGLVKGEEKIHETVAFIVYFHQGVNRTAVMCTSPGTVERFALTRWENHDVEDSWCSALNV
jgi:hypothetical protein